MKIIIKYILRNIGEKKFRTFLIIFSISLSCALFFASNTFSVTFAKMFEMRIRKFIGSSDFILHANWKSPSWFLSIHKLEPLRDSLEYAAGGFTFDGTFKAGPGSPSGEEKEVTEQLMAVSIDYDQVHIMNPLFIEEERNIRPFRGRKIIIGRDFADKYNFSPGDSIDLMLNEHKYKFYIEAIGENQGILQGEPRRGSVIIPISMARSIFKVKNRYGFILVKVKKGADREKVSLKLKELFKKYTVREAINEEERKRFMSQTTVSFQIMTILVLCISVFIIYSTFKVITMERLPVIGTFRSIGATKGTTDFLLLFESIGYGIAGGLTGIGLGFGILFIMVYIMSYNPWSGTRSTIIIDFKIYHVIFTFLLGILLCIVSSLIPILRVTKISIKDIVLQNFKTKVSSSRIKAAAGFCFLAVSLICPLVFQNKAALVVNILCLVLSVSGVILLIPSLTRGFIVLYNRVYGFLFGNIGGIAVRNLRDNKSLLNTITLLCIGISGILAINTISFSVTQDGINFFSKAHFDVWLWIENADKNTRVRLSTMKGVAGNLGIYTAWNIELKDRNSKIERIDGFSPSYLDYWEMEDLDMDAARRLGEGRNIMITYLLRDKLGILPGHKLKLKTPKGFREYRVTGFFHTTRENGNFAFISNKYLKLDFRKRKFDNIFVKTTSPPGEVLAAARKKFAGRGFWGETLKQMEKNNNDSNRQFFVILKGFSLLTLVIGIFGVVNNYVINFIERRRSLAMFRAIGMSKVQIVKMICIEALAGGFTGAAAGVLYGMVFIYISRFVMLAMEIRVPIRYSLVQFVISLIAGVIISLVSSISPALSSSKLHIIEAIKYE